MFTYLLTSTTTNPSLPRDLSLPALHERVEGREDEGVEEVAGECGGSAGHWQVTASEAHQKRIQQLRLAV